MLKLVHAAEERTDNEPMMVDIDELCRLAAKQMLATALLAERQAYLDPTPNSSTPQASAWWSPTVTPSSAR